MRTAIISLIVIFVFVAFFGKLSYVIGNPFLAYLFYILNLFVKLFPIFLTLFSIISGYLIWRHYRYKHSRRKTFHSFFQIFEILFISIFSAFVILFLVGLIQMNTLSLLINKDPSLLGIKTNTQEVYDEIKNNNVSPTIISSDKDYKNSVIAIAKVSSGTDNFYGEVVLSNIPKVLIFPVNENVPNLLFLDNSLIITRVDMKDMQKLSPLIGNLFVQNYFSQRVIKKYPKISLMDEKEYQVFRRMDAVDKVKKISLEAQKMENSISTMSATIEFTKEQIKQNDESKLTILENRDKEYNKCLSEGTYDKSNTFIPSNSRETCQKILDEWEPRYIEEENSGKELEENLKKDQEELKVFEYYDTFFKSHKELTDLSSNNIPSELGVFIPDNTVKVVLLNYKTNAVANYFVTLVHEYLHYASYTPGKRLESSFFEEGLTEYFAKQAVKDSMGKTTNIGYPVVEKIIGEFMNKIPEKDLADIYFTKDQSKLVETLNLVNGEGFYQDNIVSIESLMYISDPEQSLEIANKILDKIGGEKLEMKDLYSN